MTGHKTWAVGEEVVQTDFQGFVADQIAAQYASAAARASGWAGPPNGALSALTSLDTTHGLEVFNGTAWRKPWNMPWGLVDMVANTTGQTSPAINAVTDLTGLTSTQTYVANRRLKVTGYLPQADSSAAACVWVLYVVDPATGSIARSQVTAPATGQPQAPVAIGMVSPTVAGARTYKLQGSTGSTGGRYTAAANQPAYLLIEDVGPAGPPA